MIRFALALGVTALGLAGAAFAHDGHKEDDRTETIIIKRVHGGPDKAMAHGDHVMLAKCDGAPDVDVADEGKDGDKVKRQRIVICNKGAMGPQVIEALERARKSLAEQRELSDEARSKALAALDAAIARHREAAPAK